MKKFFLCAFFYFFLSHVVFAGQFSNFYFLGDSLTDIGNNPGCDSSIPGGSKQPNSKNWAQFIAEKYGQTVIKSDAGGNNFCYGGAESGYESRVTGASLDHNRGARTQVNQLITRETSLNSKAFYSLYIGGNDIIGYFLGQTGKTKAQVTTECGSNITASLNKLHDAGARIIVVGNLPDMSNIPLFYDTGDTSVEAKTMSEQYNENVRSSVNNLGFDVIQIDLYGLFADAISNKTRYGFLHGPEDAAMLHPGDNYDDYIYWDVAHPTQAVYRIMADYYYSVLQAPYYFASLTETPYKAATVRNDIIRQRLSQQSASPKKLNIFADADPNKSSSGLNVGCIYRISQPLSVGVGFSSSQNRGSIDGGAYTYDLNNTALSLFAEYRQDLFYLNAITGLGNLQYRNIARQITLGPVTESVSATTNGYQYTVGVSGGYRFPAFVDGLETGLMINTTYQNTGVDGYSENGEKEYLQMTYNNQRNETLDVGIGCDIDFKKPVTPQNTFIASANLRVNRQLLDNERNIQFNLQSIVGSHGAVPVNNPADCYASAGISAGFLLFDFATISLDYNGYFGNDRYKNNVINLGVGLFFF